MPKAPLRIFFLAHQQSQSAGEMALALVDRFQEPPATGGLRVPVFMTPDKGDDLPPGWGEEGISLDESEHTVVVVLSDARMTRSVAKGTGREWKAFLDEGVARAPAASSAHRVFGTALDERGFGLSDDRHMLRVNASPSRGDDDTDESFSEKIAVWIDETVDNLALEITVEIVKLFNPSVAPKEGTEPITLFLSHAKKDLDPGENDPVRLIEEDIKELPVKHWFDAAEIPPGEKFEAEILQGIQDCSIVVAFLTDSYASRPWCQREILDAKKLGLPILVVEALSNGEPRNFPYLGNLPTIHWAVQSSKEKQKVFARKIVGRAIRETMRFMHNRAVLKNQAASDETVLASAPEAVALAWQHEDPQVKRRFFYPDPPLSKQELDVLRRLRPNAKFATPLTKLARRKLPEGISAVAVSISESGDLARYGISEKQVGTLVDEIHLYLLLAGLQIAYGGGLSANFDKASNFTLRLFELVRSYSELAQSAGVEGDLAPILNYPPWPLHLGYGDREYDLFGEIAELVEGQRPTEQEVPESDEELFPPLENAWRWAPTNPAQRLAWTRGLTLMRKQVTGGVQARIVIGGKMEDYFGLFPGVVEEAWLSVMAGQALYLIGAFGGAAHAVIEALDGDGSALVASCNAVVQVDEVIALATERGGEVIDASGELEYDEIGAPDKLVVGDRMAADFQRAGRAGPAAALRNGLTDEENRELFRSSDPAHIAELILSGLSQLEV